MRDLSVDYPSVIDQALNQIFSSITHVNGQMKEERRFIPSTFSGALLRFEHHIKAILKPM